MKTTLPHILLLSEPVPPRHGGGAGKVAWDLAVHLSKKSFKVTLICIDPEVNEDARLGNLRRIRVACDDYGWNAKTFEQRRKVLLPLLVKLHADKFFDLIHDVGGFLYFQVFCEFLKIADVPSITHLLLLMGPYLYEVKMPQWSVHFFHSLQELQCGASDVVITTSRAESRFYKRLFHPSKAREIMIPNGIKPPELDQERYSIWRDKLRRDDALLLFVGGRISDVVKGTDRAVELCRQVKRQGLNVRLISTDLRPGADGEIPLEIESLGRLEEPDFSAVIANMDVVLCPSRYEAFGLLAVEAVSLGVHVVASQAGGFLDTVAGHPAGLVIDDEKWSRPDGELLAYFRNIKRGVRHQRPIDQNHTIGHMSDSIAQLYEQILRKEHTV